MLAACSPQPHRHSDAEIERLAADAHVIVGDTRLIVPMIALSGYVAMKPSFSLDRAGDRQAFKERRDAFWSAASEPETAPVLDRVEMRIHAYGWDDNDSSMRRICAKLTRAWSRSLCDDPWAPLNQAMPGDAFYLADTARFASFDNTITVGGEKMGDQLRAIRLISGQATLMCDRHPRTETRFCTAAMLLAPRMAAVWTVAETPGKEGAQARADREGRVIAAFVRDALGPGEDFAALQAVACRSRAPGSPKGIHGDPCAVK